MTALGLGSSAAYLYRFIKFGISYGGIYYASTQPTDSFTQFIQSIAPSIISVRLPASCAMFAHILLAAFVLIDLVLLISGRPKKRKTKYLVAGTLGGILLLLTLLSRLYVYKTLSISYFVGDIFFNRHSVLYLLILILFSLATSYGLFRILSVSVLRTKAKDASDRQD